LGTKGKMATLASSGRPRELIWIWRPGSRLMEELTYPCPMAAPRLWE